MSDNESRNPFRGKPFEATGDVHDRESTLGDAPLETPSDPQPMPVGSIGGIPTIDPALDQKDMKDWIGLELAGGRYRVVRVLGQGGMGVVYLAEDYNLEEQVVVKCPHPHLLKHAAALSRFIREVKSLIRLRHPHVCRVREAGEYGGTPFVVLDYLSGGSLVERRPKGSGGLPSPMSIEQVLAWLSDIARALDFIHGKGHVHRDVKPSNILFDAEGNAYLTDFGIVKALGRGGQAEAASLTGPGTFLGTPEYTVPEVFAGEDYDGRADQYSLAVVVYELLAGQRPFEGPTPFAIVQKQTATIPAGLHRLNPRIGQGVSEAVLKALSTLPEDRYPDCGRFVQAMDRARQAELPKSPAKPRVAAPRESRPVPASLPSVPARPQPARSSPPAPPAQKAVPKPLAVITNSIGMKLVLIPAGEFLMGSPDSDTMAESNEKPQHRVRITKPFYLGVYPVTQTEYERVMGGNPSCFKGDPSRPVEQVSWDEAQEFCRKLSALAEERVDGQVYRLPTEAQWEYACRAGTITRWCFGDQEELLGEYAWFENNSGDQTHPAGQKKPNAWGLYDMHGKRCNTHFSCPPT